ncbi:hypothetical protein O4214_21440 [Rhodococcus erythropolis]|uniref:hypothetical protein n=1 Tax=Rhodococcus erythropolis TaxID=1833 RepID=UPI001E315CB7|nr:MULTISPECIES: hypothetical protein [Rhodococcus erythropolis group]MCD2107125.1 hypothetical protein [Rhodococcus qingshengii]MCZ4526554.1 hypothetical protein [Rhodococcus erythropolis]
MTTTDTTVLAAEVASTTAPQPIPVRRGRFSRTADRVDRWSARRRSTVLIPLGVVAAALSATVVLLGMELRTDSLVSSAKVDALDAANINVPKILSYNADSIDADLSAAAGHLTSDFKTQFVNLTQQSIIPPAKQLGITTAASVAANSVVSATPDAVTVLMFLNQSTTTTESSTPKLDSSRVRVDLQKVDGNWLISGLQPV